MNGELIFMSLAKSFQSLTRFLEIKNSVFKILRIIYNRIYELTCAIIARGKRREQLLGQGLLALAVNRRK